MSGAAVTRMIVTAMKMEDSTTEARFSHGTLGALDACFQPATPTKGCELSPRELQYHDNLENLSFMNSTQQMTAPFIQVHSDAWLDEEVDRAAPLNPSCYLAGKRAVITIDASGVVNVSTSTSPLSLTPRPRVGPLLNAGHAVSVPLAETAAVEMRSALQSSMTKLCGGNDSPAVVLHTFRRRGMDWIPSEVAIEFDDERAAQRWAYHIQCHLDLLPGRPRRLFVVMNPYGGRREADNVWRDVAKPIFDRAHITCDAFRTGYRDHAKELIAQMSLEEFQRYDGIVAVGGDGLFQECLRGVLAQRKKGGAWRDKAAEIRIAQIPAGSTDAVACTVNGSRSPHTAALHVALGDRASLDVLEVRTIEGEQRYSCSTTSYGFIADILERSESLRWMGPARYDYCGLMTFMRLKAYPVRIYYKRPSTSHAVRRVCGTACQICTQPGQHRFDTGEGEADFSEVASAAAHSRSASADAHDCFTGLPLTDFMTSRPASTSGGTADSFPPSHDDEDEGRPSPAAAPALETVVREVELCSISAGGGGDGGEASAGGASPSTDDGGGGGGRLPRTRSDDWFNRIRVDRADGDGDAGPMAPGDNGWRMWEGEISSLMVVVTSTRSDKSKHGIVPHAHLSDGRLHLVIVRKCTRMQFFRFLIGVTRGGVDESLDYVDVKEVEAWRLEPLDTESAQSAWNVDGELTQTKCMSARCHHGLVEVFGRGPEV